jgi:Ca-activated chloride channel family protein
LKAGIIATIEIDYITMCDADNSNVRFFLPTTISPRYLPSNLPDENGIPSFEIVNPKFSKNVPYSIFINLDIYGKDQISQIESPSHFISTTFENDFLKVNFCGDSTTMDRDFVLNIKYHKNFKNRAFICSKDGKHYLQLDICPTCEDKKSTSKLNKEIILLMDCSGSMQGSSIIEAKKALNIFLNSLDKGIYFSLYLFGSNFEKYSDKSLKLSSDMLANIIGYLPHIEANMGGTEILAPIRDILYREPLNKLERSVILITDGEVGNENEILDIVSRYKEHNTFFTVGIGNGPNEYFIKELARATGGTYELIAPNERIEPGIKRLLEKVINQPITDISFCCGNPIEMVSNSSAIYLGQCESYFSEIEDKSSLSSEVIITGKVNGNTIVWSSTIKNIHDNETSIPIMWAKKKYYSYRIMLRKNMVRQEGRKDKLIQQEIVYLAKNYGFFQANELYCCRKT